MLKKFEDILIKNFPHSPTKGQLNLFKQISKYVLSKQEKTLLIVKGYAGTGKTTMIRSLVKTLPVINYKSVLLAPTGRAAKVITTYTGKSAYTIHKKLYLRKTIRSGRIVFKLQKNFHKNTIFIIDESSMISNKGGNNEQLLFGNKSLLDDLFKYINEGENCKLIFIGDTAQLPPVGLDISPALNEEYLQATFGYNVQTVELTDVVRQKKESGILENATQVRELIRQNKVEYPVFITKRHKDFKSIYSNKLEDGIRYAYDKFGRENTILICYSNKSANRYNQQIRKQILDYENEIEVGDYLMVVRNNYYWLSLEDKSEIDFIANGDIVKITKIIGFEEKYGFRFADIKIKFLDYPDEPELTVKIFLDVIMEETASLSFEKQKTIFDAVINENEHIKNKRKRTEAAYDDEYFNALQVKFAYAVTCHKSQGGQWKLVFIDQGYLNDEMFNIEYLRWLYTAISRATDELYLVNFNSKFLKDGQIQDIRPEDSRSPIGWRSETNRHPA